MIKIESAHIEEFRGIRNLDIELNGKTFAVSGPNGSGKSGVIDAIEFGLTGQIRRLTGTGTKSLSIKDHGPHVDRTKFPDAAFVELELSFPSIGKKAKIKRTVSAPKKLKIEPSDADICAILEDVALHPEITLARREILKFILVEPTKRSDEIQAILKIEELGQTRSSLNSAFGKLKREASTADGDLQRKRETLRQHLGIDAIIADQILPVVNKKRQTLGLDELSEIKADTVLDQGLAEPSNEQPFNKNAALLELSKMTDKITELSQTQSSTDRLVSLLSRLEVEPDLLLSLRLSSLVEHGLKLVDGPECPVCDHKWPDQAHLLEHLHSKQEKSKSAAAVKREILDQASIISDSVSGLNALLSETCRIAKAEKNLDLLIRTEAWGKDLGAFQEQLGEFDDIMKLKDRLTKAWHALPNGFHTVLTEFVDQIRAKPDQSDKLAAQTFLLNAAERFKDFINARTTNASAKKARESSEFAYNAWCGAMEEELEALYEAVEADFSKFYRILNDGDEEKFVARLKATEGRLDFDVNFYERGLFPPGAFHSEGHQDGMGVCLYLALMKRLLADGFTVALLDDVVMSVDAGHRYQFCKLLMSEFPNTQFVIATHDRLWAEQMRSAGLISRKSSIAFHSWTVESGPLVESNIDIWDEIDEAMAKGNVGTAAHSLRCHLEFISRLLADQLGARPVFKADGNYDLGDLLPSSISRLREHLGKAIDCAQSWGNEPMKEIAAHRKAQLKAANTKKGEEDWAVNRAVHHNEWANFSKNDFEPVVQAFKDVLSCAQCSECHSWLYITPKQTSPEALRCSCGSTNLNLKNKTS